MPDSASTSGASFTIRAYRDRDERAILDLFARSFPHAPRGVEHFRWKYRENPFGNEHISLAFDADARLVGHYAGYAVPFRIDGRDVLAHQIGDTMTDVAIRHIGRGPTSILGRTALHFYEHFCDGRVAFNYGFNVANIQKFSLRFLRSDRVEPVMYRVRDLRAHPLAPLPRMQRWARGYQLELVRETTAEFDELFARVAPAYRFLVRRDARYLRWRYLDCPDTQYVVVAIRKWRTLVGWIAFRIRENRFVWGDALFDPDFADAAEVVLRHVVPSYPVDAIEAWFPPRPAWFDATLRELAFETRPEPQDLSVMCVPFALADATARMRDGLYYTWGDSDLF
ncbi:MAG: GNAT family N-acetyltransferase [Acidobacteria bacterium]|nr:GNAT family N-acetyltransferase [Acidobacteriota bacterium]MBV9476428.1 GNAT family N-acetyltransferase [Acidobacteriota bacterium]